MRTQASSVRLWVKQVTTAELKGKVEAELAGKNTLV